MKVLIINSVCGIRSTGRICSEIAQKYMENGHTCCIAYGREHALNKYGFISYRIGSEIGVKKNALLARILDNDGFLAKLSTKKFLKWASNYNPDVLWLHNLHGYYINIELLFDWIKQRPQMHVKWTFHDCWPFTGHCAHFDFAKCDHWQQHCHNCVQKKEYPKSWLCDGSRVNFQRKKNAFCGVHDMTIITPSNWLASLVGKSYLRCYPVEVHHNTIDTSIFRPTPSDFREKMGLINRKIVLGVATAWGPKKGLQDFILLSQMLDNRYAIVLVGVNELQKKQLPESIICIPCTNSAQKLAEIYTAADVFVNLTYEDTYPTVNLESQACGTPCLTYKTGGSVESVPAENIIEQGDIDSMINKITNICMGK